MLINLGIGPATIFYIAKKKYPIKVVLGNNLIIAIFIGVAGFVFGYLFILFYGAIVFPGLEPKYFYMALFLVMGNIGFNYFQGILLGKLIIEKYNIITLIQSILIFVLVIVCLPILKLGISGVILANIISVYLATFILFFSALKISGGISYKLNIDYIKSTLLYGFKAHTGNIIAFLIYKIDLFLIGGLINPAAVGFYSVSSGLAERLWMVSQTASFVLFPKVALEKNEKKRKEFTPLVSRNVFLLTIVGGFFLIMISEWLITLLYSSKFEHSVTALQVLIPGIIMLSAGRVLSNDISGRGKPEISIYSGTTALILNIILNIILIPIWGITGAALASSVSYTLSFLITLYFYCKISGNSWIITIIPQKADLILYQKFIKQFLRRSL